LAGRGSEQFPEHGDLIQESCPTLHLPVTPQHGRVDHVTRTITHGGKDFCHIAAHRRRHHQNQTRRRRHDLPGSPHPLPPPPAHRPIRTLTLTWGRAATPLFPPRTPPVPPPPGHFCPRAPPPPPPQRFHGQRHVVDNGNPHAYASPIRSTTACNSVSS